MSQVAVYPGSFDPITLGHIDIINRISPLFEKVIVLVALSSQKSSLFSQDEKRALLEATLKHLPNVSVDFHEGLTTDYMKKHQAGVIVRGLRAVADFEYEMTMANMNKKLAPQIETMLICSRPEYYFISSRGVKEVATHGGSLKPFVPEVVEKALLKKFSR